MVLGRPRSRHQRYSNSTQLPTEVAITTAARTPKNATAAMVAGMSATSTSRMMMCVVTALEI